MSKTYASVHDELHARQKSLIPLNIFVILLAVVAALSILFLPLLKIEAESIGELAGTFAPESGESGAETEDTQSPDGSETDEAFDPAALLEGIPLTLSVTGMDLARIGFAEAPAEVLTEKLGGALSDVSDELTARALMALSSEAPAEAEALEEMLAAVRQLEAAQSDEEVDTAVAAVEAVLKTHVGADAEWDSAQVQSQLRTMYDDTVAETGGAFSAEAFLCVQASKAMNESEDVGTQIPVVTNFADLFAAMLSQGEEDIFAQIPSFIFPALGGAMLLFAGVWIILLLFALLHIFAKNRRFMMWYVKLFGFFPCLIFGVAPLVVPILIQDAAVAAVFGMISSLSWVSGACYLLLWFVSIFWAFPIKRRIRALNKQI